MQTLTTELPRSIAQLRDPSGVLSVYVTVDPVLEASEAPPWVVTVRTELAAVLRRAGENDPRRAAAWQQRLADLERPLGKLLDAAAPGRGRALFAALDPPAVRTVSVQLPMTTAVALDASPYLWPLVAAYAAGSPAGVVAVGGHGVRLVEISLGLARDVATLTYEPATEPPSEHGRGAWRDLADRRAAEHLTRFLADAGGWIARYALDGGWDPLVVTGEGDQVAAAIQGLPPGLRDLAVHAHHVAGDHMPAPRLAAMVEPIVHEARLQRRRALAQEARDAALCGGSGALGLVATLSALDEGRVRHLLLDGGRRWTGRRSAAGRLYAGDDPAAPETVEREPDLGERMVEAAYRTDAQVTILDPAAAEPLDDGDGVAALLRW